MPHFCNFVAKKPLLQRREKGERRGRGERRRPGEAARPLPRGGRNAQDSRRTQSAQEPRSRDLGVSLKVHDRTLMVLH